MPLRYEACTFAYRAGEPVLRSLNLQFPSGCSVLLGPNGAGKSTTLSLGASVHLPRSGRVMLGALDSARSRDRGNYRRKWGGCHNRSPPSRA